MTRYYVARRDNSGTIVEWGKSYDNPVDAHAVVMGKYRAGSGKGWAVVAVYGCE